LSFWVFRKTDHVLWKKKGSLFLFLLQKYPVVSFLQTFVIGPARSREWIGGCSAMVTTGGGMFFLLYRRMCMWWLVTRAMMDA
jgi:hypothetical protein